MVYNIEIIKIRLCIRQHMHLLAKNLIQHDFLEITQLDLFIFDQGCSGISIQPAELVEVAFREYLHECKGRYKLSQSMDLKKFSNSR